MKRHPTQQDVANLAGVSQAVVSAVVNSRRGAIGVSDAVRAHVRATAESLGYRVHADAQSMRRRKFGSIGYLAPGRFRWEFDFPGTRPGLFDAAHGIGKRIVYARADSENEIPSVLREFCLDGLVIHDGGKINATLSEFLVKHEIPAVFLNHKQRYNAVYVDDVGAASEMTRHLLSQGYKRILFLSTMSFIEGHHSWSDRKKGFEDTMIAAGLVPRSMLIDGTKREEAKSAFLDTLEAETRPDAVLCHGDHDAAVLQSYLFGSKWLFPRDFALAGFGAEPTCSNYLSLPLTTMRICRYGMAQSAVHLLARLMDDTATVKVASTIVRPSLVEGLSTPSTQHKTKKTNNENTH